MYEITKSLKLLNNEKIKLKHQNKELSIGMILKCLIYLIKSIINLEIILKHISKKC